MSTPSRTLWPSLRRLLVFAVIPLATAGSVAHAQTTLYWDTGTSSGLTPGNGTWSTSTSDLFWATSTSPGTATPTFWTDGSIANFQASVSNGVTISGTVTANAVQFAGGAQVLTSISGGTLIISGTNGFSTSGGNGTSGSAISSSIILGTGSAATYRFNTTSSQNNFSISGNISENGVAGITKLGPNSLTLSGTNTYSGVTTISAGSLNFTKRVSLYNANTSSWTASNFVNGAIVNFAVGGTGEFTDSDIGTLAGLGTGAGGFLNGSRIGLDTTNASGGIFTLSSTIANPNGGANVLGLSKLGTNTLTLTALNTYSGQTVLSGGTLRFDTIADVGGGASSLGAPTTAANGQILLNQANSTATLLYVGAGSTTNRNLNGSSSGGTGSYVIDSSGSGPLVFTNAIAITGGVTNVTGQKLWTLQGSYVGSANEFRGLISGSGVSAITKAGAGTWKLSGTNTYGGVNTINAGVLEVTTLANGGVASGIGASSNAASNLVFGAASATLRYSGTANVTTDRGFTYNSAVGGGATIESSGVGTLSFDNTVAIALGTTNQTRVLTLGGTNAGNNTFSKVIANNGTGATSLTKAGSGVWVLDGANTFSGTVTIGEGTIAVASIGNGGSNGPLGTSGTIALGTSTTVGTLRYTGAGETTNRALNLSGTTGSGGTLEANGSGPLAFTGAVTAASGNKTLTLAGSNTGSNSLGVISGSPISLVKTGIGSWMLTGSSSYGGTTNVDQGTLILAASAENTLSGSGALGTNTNGVTIGSASGSGTAALLLNQNVTVGARNITIPAVVSGSQVVVLGGTNTNGTSTFSNGVNFDLGRDVTLQAATGGTTRFLSTWTNGTGRTVTVGSAGNAGTVQLESALSVTGAVSVSNGTLRLAAGGSITNPTSVIVGTVGSTGVVLDVTPQTGTFSLLAAQSLSGIGTIRLDADTPVAIAGFFSPGNSPGIFIFDGAGTTTLSGTTFMEITGTTAGTSYDQVRFTNSGSLDYGSGRLLLDLTDTYADNTQFQLFDFVPTASGSFTTISGSGSYGSLSFVRGVGGVWTSGPTTQPSQSLEFREATGTLVVVPEPATLALAAIGIGLTGWAAIRRRK